MNIEELLRGAEIRTPAYTPEQRAADDRVLRERINEELALRARLRRLQYFGWLVPTSPELAVLLNPATGGKAAHSRRQVKRRLQTQLKTLSRTVMTAPGGHDRLEAFIDAERPADPIGARAFGCLLFLSGKAAHARFWWRFAAGAGDSTAGYLLFLEALLRDATKEALHCFRLLDGLTFVSDPDGHTPADGVGEPAVLEADVGNQIQEVNTGRSGPGNVLIPQGYLDDVSEQQREGLLCHQ
ncbi:hypothetical protein QMK19_35550 [Streptomyces sp. H10-C2]|uniref:hypothetical protein n=1 Tax=unclassified Streptomyces TaxID=2593676 RepID=UPI0024B9D78C|nr:MULTISPECIES: hypothetical protein [unclassified Streptomyces]MDJ0347434.1 hypothetical protein [Streptomyces sp. PH10-H1]MDJ0374799.1 hypothetical protein [Streptomyces sp. H10-C2]